VNATYAPQNATYYNVAGCERMEYHVIKYTGAGVLTEGTIVNNATPECWFIIDEATGPEDVGTVTYVWNTPSDCQPCINSHTTTTSTTTTAPPVVNSVRMLTTEYYTTAAIYLADFNQQYYLLIGGNGFTLYYTGTLGVGTTLYFNSNLTDPAGTFAPFYLIETLATQGNPYAQPTDRIFTIDSNGTLTAQVSTIAQASYTQWQIDKRTGNVNGLCSDLNPGGFLAAPGTFTYDVGTQIYASSYNNGVWATFLDAYMSDGTYRYTTNGSGLLVSKELCSSITTTTTTTTIAPFNYTVGYYCEPVVNSTELFITIGPSVNGVPLYDIGFYFFDSEAEALANTEWRDNAINQYTSFIYPSSRSVNSTYWVVARDGNGTTLAKSVTTNCSFTSTTTTTTTEFPGTYFFEATVDNSVSLACLGGDPQTLYTTSRIVTIGSFVYQDLELTVPFTGYFSINAAPTNYYECNSNGEVILIEACPILSYDFIATENNDALITEDGNNLIMNYPLPTSEIITEDGNFIITENGDNLTTQ